MERKREKGQNNIAPGGWLRVQVAVPIWSRDGITRNECTRRCVYSFRDVLSPRQWDWHGKRNEHVHIYRWRTCVRVLSRAPARCPFARTRNVFIHNSAPAGLRRKRRSYIFRVPYTRRCISGPDNENPYVRGRIAIGRVPIKIQHRQQRRGRRRRWRGWRGGGNALR